MSVAVLPPTTNGTSGPAIRSLGTTWIYFLLADGERVKIGESKNYAKRFREHGATKLGISQEVKPLVWLRGKVADESAIQRYFAQWSWNGEGEVFHPADEVLEYVRWLRNQYYVAVPEMTTAEIESLPVIDSSNWLPNESRRKRPPQPALPGLVFDRFDFGGREITGDDFYTNEVIVEAARAVMGRIDLDPASHVVANRVVKASAFYSIGDNGLMHPWSGKVWLNPPFSQWQEWVPKVLEEWGSGRVAEMCVLSAMRTLTARYFAPLLGACHATCIIHGRIKFWGGVAGDSPDDGHAIFYFGHEPREFAKQFSKLGTVFFAGGIQ